MYEYSIALQEEKENQQKDEQKTPTKLQKDQRYEQY